MMTMNAVDVLNEFFAGRWALDQVMEDFSRRDWDKSPKWENWDDDFAGNNTWAAVSSDSRLTSEQYEKLAQAVQFPSGEDDLTAAAEHTGAMIALIPAATDLERLAVDGGEPTEELHVTLGYLGEAALIPHEVQHAVVQRVAQCVADQVSIIGNAFAVAMFNPETGDGTDLVAAGKEPCVVLLISGSQLVPFHNIVMHEVGLTFARAQMEMYPQHSPWVAHLTLAYTDDPDLSYFTDRTGPVTFDRVRVAFGGTVIDLPLGSGSGTTVEEG